MMMDFVSLYQKYAPAVRRFALYLSGDPALADDITSDTFLRAWVAQGKIREPTVKSYLFMIARNAYYDLRRRAWRHTELDEIAAVEDTSVQKRLEEREEAAAVLAALQDLPEVGRTILLMRALEDMPYDEIAAVLDINVTTAKVKVHRARILLMRVRNPAQGKMKDSGEKP
jgi:RNA polymerase sigma-70 factor, ECF subfamily